MVQFQVAAVINRPAEIVADALNNAENFPYWQTDLVKFEVIQGEPNKAGAVGHLHYVQGGRPYILEDRLVYCEPGKKYISEVSGDALTASVETTLVSLGERTEMRLKWSGRGIVFPLTLMLPLLRGRMVKQAKIELETFKRLVETRGSDFSRPPEDSP